MTNLKQKLLSLNVFVDNEYLDFYCDLIDKNRLTKKAKKETQSHHIVPKCYFTVNHLEIDNSKDNLVNLKYTDHILAHYYLCLCCIDNKNIKYRIENAFLCLTNKKTKIQDFNPETDLEHFNTIYESWRIANSQSRLGKKHWYYGKHLTEEHRENIRKGLIDVPRTKEWSQKISESKKGHFVSDETKQKISKTKKEQHIITSTSFKKGSIPWNKGKKGLQKAANAKIVLQYDLDSNFIQEFESTVQASKVLSLNSSSIARCCRNERKAYNGYIWRYKN